MIKKIMLTILIIIVILGVSIFLFLKHPLFGMQEFSGERLEKMKNSPNFKDGHFENLEPVFLAPEVQNGGIISGLYNFLFKKYEDAIPEKEIPTQKTDLKNLSPDENILVWFGHSSYFLQIGGKKFLVDPVFSESASPVWGINKAFKGTNIYSVEDLPEIDFLIITHDHYDHLDYQTIKKLQPKVSKIITPLGVGGHFELWGYDTKNIYEKDWWEEVDFGENVKITLTPTRHFSGRKLNGNNTLWGSYVLEVGGKKIFIGGDSGYGKHFKEIGEKFGPFDFAFLENGQYNEAWPNHHSHPDEVVTEALELQAKNIIPVHSAKFKLSTHKWYEPLQKVTELSQGKGFGVITPIIGEKINLDKTEFETNKWWEKVL